MKKMDRVLNERLKNTKPTTKMTRMAQQTAEGNRTTFSGLFSVGELSGGEKEQIEAILERYSSGNKQVRKDATRLVALTAEIKAIDTQAAILHGERIHRAHEILTLYKEGAFTAWLYATYGNRQTPYNFYQYYLFYQAAPATLRPRIEAMPRQAVYSLAARHGDFSQKVALVEAYRGESKEEVLQSIRSQFPLHREDRRQVDFGTKVLQQLSLVYRLLQREKGVIKKKQKEQIALLMDAIDEEIFGS